MMKKNLLDLALATTSYQNGSDSLNIIAIVR